MHIRDQHQIYIPEDSGKAEKVLILTPASRSEPKDTDSQLIFSIFEIGSQIKLRGCEAVFPVADVNTVQPKCKTAFHTIKADVHRVIFHVGWKCKIPHIARYRVELLRDLSRLYILHAVPGILRIYILWMSISLHLDMSRNPDIRPAPAVILFFLKALDRIRVILRVRKFPDTVQ